MPRRRGIMSLFIVREKDAERLPGIYKESEK
jgi:hypothetical protein